MNHAADILIDHLQKIRDVFLAVAAQFTVEIGLCLFVVLSLF